MRPVDVRVDCRELVLERIAHEALRSQVVALIGLNRADHAENTREAFQRRWVKLDAIEHFPEPPQVGPRILQGYPPDETMDLVAFLQQELRQIGPVLPSDSRDQYLLHVRS